jgi:hypothetical protein
MRRLSTLLFILCSFLFGSLSAQDFSVDDQSVVMKVNGFNEEVNMAIYTAFQQDNKLSIINSCDVLGLVVFAPKAGYSSTKAQSKSYITVKLNELKAQMPGGFKYVDELSAGEVLIQCREKMQELYSEGSE